MSAAPVMILAGGTGGHIFPGLAVARVLEAQAVPVVWVGARGGMETRLVPQAGVPLETIAIRGLRGKGPASLLLAPFMLLRAMWQALALLRRLRPRAVISFGGYAAGPAGLGAWLLRRPLLVHEQNRAPGVTNRILATLARRVLCGFPDTFASARAEMVGNPVRIEIATLPPPAIRFAQRRGAPLLLVLGGSQGARSLNTALPQVLARLALEQRPRLRHQCGERHVENCRRAYREAGVTAQVEPFIADMAAALAEADLVLCRAGALTLAELCAAGVGSVLVPLPTAADDHQTCNAEFLVERGGARLVPEGEGFETRVHDALIALLGDAPARLRLAEAARACARSDAAERVAQACIAEGAT